MSWFLLVSVVVALLCGVAQSTDGGVVACYYSSWAIENNGVGEYGVGDLPTQCTHIMYAFYDLSADGEVIVPSEATYSDSKKSSEIAAFAKLKSSFPGTKFLLSFGGWSYSTNFTFVANNDTARANFAKKAVALMKDLNLDGIDIAWDYPGLRNGGSSDKVGFVSLLSDVRKAFGDENYLLTAAVAVTQTYIDAGYNVTGMAEYLDYFWVQAYEYHGTWDGVTGANAPTYAQETDSSTTNLNVNYSISVWLENGAPANKMVLGVASFAKTFTLSDTNNTSLGAATSGAGEAGPYTGEAGTLAYYEVCEYLSNDTTGWTVVEVPKNYVYAYKGSQWIGYDNPSTVYYKGKLAAERGLAGIFIWSIDQDDFSGKCGDAYPLLTQAAAGYKSGVSS